MKRLLYIGYFIKNTNWQNLINNIKEVSIKENITSIKIITDILYSSFKYKASFEDYFEFRFFEKNSKQRNDYLTTGRAYEFHNKMNLKEKRYIFRKKNIFNKTFDKFIKRDYLYLDNNFSEFKEWIKNKDEFIAKPNQGTVGKGIEIFQVGNNSSRDLYNELIDKNLRLVEQYIEQHKILNDINPSSVNTIRIITVLNNDDVLIIGALLRMSKNKFVDNLSRGGLAAPVDIDTGEIFAPAVSKYVYEDSYEKHPVTNRRIRGSKIPLWQEVKNMIKKAAKIEKEIKTVGWDVAITANGPELIEGNDNWGKTLYQIPYKNGKMDIIRDFKVN